MIDWIVWIKQEIQLVYQDIRRILLARDVKPFIFADKTGIDLFIDGRNGQPINIHKFEDVASKEKRKLRDATLKLAPSLGLQRQIADIVLPVRQAKKASLLDLKSATPVNPDEVQVFHQRYQRSNSNTRYVVVKSEALTAILVQLRKLGISPQKIEVDTDEDTFALDKKTMQRMQLLNKRTFSSKRLAAALVFLCVVGSVFTLSHMYIRQTDALATLNLDIENKANQVREIRTELVNQRKRVDWLKQISKERFAKPTMVSIVDELSEIVPDTAWITDLDVSENVIKISGFAQSASALISEFDKSDLFTSPSISGRVLRNQDQASERFSITMELVTGS